MVRSCSIRSSFVQMAEVHVRLSLPFRVAHPTIPTMPTTLVPDFGRQVMAVDRVQRLLRQVTEALDRAGVPYAVIGGNAVAAWVMSVDEGAVRATKDVDILLRRADLALAREALEREGLEQHDIHGITMFLLRENPNPKTGVHVVFAGEKVRSHTDHPAPDVGSAVRSESGFFVLQLPQLLAMKLAAYCRIDQVHVEDKLGVGLIDKKIAAWLPADLRARLEHIEKTREEPHW